ncbi:MAG: hypothetical protein L6Q65_12225 [Zoogloea sp.]|nr:hypothetical protein [Zoogloea sp.]
MSEKPLCPPSLAQLFDAPPDHQGVFGWLCGYSADADFLNQAVERFTLETAGQRAHRGRISLALILDPGQPAIGPVDVPGVAHLPLRRADARPFRLLHAKFALLGFRGPGDGAWRLRLIVSTGNWTRQTVEESLDLAWSMDVDSAELAGHGGGELAERCADLKAAWELLGFLQGLFDLRLLDAGRSGRHRHGETVAARDSLAEWAARCVALAGPRSRFIDNRRQSLLEQLAPRVLAQAGEGARNYLAMGSGFFESATGANATQVPGVLAAIVAALRGAGLLTASATIDVFINPLACQAVAGAVRAINDAGWSLRPAAPMEVVFGRHAQRSLHAKFLFSARERSNSAACGGAWVYLGSGNLTGPGFASPMSAHGGNLETGVVFAPEGLEWPRGGQQAAATLVTNLLPLQRNDKVSPEAPPAAGADMPEPGEAHVAPPLAWLVWTAREEGGLLQADGPMPDGLAVLDAAGTPCVRADDGFLWPASRPRQVRLSWQDAGRARECLVPVMDEFGRLAATDLASLGFEEAWWALMGFPAAPDDDRPPGADDGAGDEGDDYDEGGGGGGAGGVAPYPVRQMMELIENIAAKQTALARADWPAWCARLEQTLARIAGSPVVAYFQALGLNPLSPLRGAAFRPDFAEADGTREGEMYVALLARLEEKWGVGGLQGIGAGVR